ncbi:MAG: FAD-binding oxidoreductase [Gammaproteobacteria bacterium]
MNYKKTARRNFIKRLVSLCVLSAAGLFRAPVLFARTLADGLDRIKGRIIRRADTNYELWRASMVWYIFKPRRYPDTIIQIKSEQDVIEAINYARSNRLKVALRATGHNPARAVLRNGGVLIDLSPLQKVEIDAGEKTAWIQPGIRSEELINLTRKKGLSFPAAHTGMVGLGGYLIGGGLGWNMPEWDIACRSILAAEIITAEGRKVTATPTGNQDLYWAVRGAGPGFFGAVTRYKIRLYPLPRAITKSKYLLPIKELPAITEILNEWVNVKQERLEILAVVGRFYPPNAAPEKQELVCAISVVAFAGSPQEARSLLEPVAQSQIPEMSLLKKENIEMTYPQLYAGQSTDFSSPSRTAVENIWTDQPAMGLTKLAEKLQHSPPPSPRSFALSAWGVNPDKQDDDSSFTYAADHYISWYLIAEEAAHIEPNYRWMDQAVAMMHPLARGHYMNEIDPARYPVHVRACFSKAKWKRLNELRLRYDPDGVFHTYLGHS